VWPGRTIDDSRGSGKQQSRLDRAEDINAAIASGHLRVVRHNLNKVDPEAIVENIKTCNRKGNFLTVFGLKHFRQCPSRKIV
jgi:hypothetical protein